MTKDSIFIYGKHPALEAIKHNPKSIEQIWVAKNVREASTLSHIESVGIVPLILDPNKLPGGLRSDAVHQGYVISLNPDSLTQSYESFVKNLEVTPDTCIAVLGELQDPHNVGAVIRSAAAFGITAVIIPSHNQAPVNATVVKVSAGMAFKVPLIKAGNVNKTLMDLKKRGFWIYGLAGGSETSLHSEKFDSPTVIVLGNEGSGLREKTREHCDFLLSIPMHSRAESLNAAAAAAATFYAWSSHHLDVLSQ